MIISAMGKERSFMNLFTIYFLMLLTHIVRTSFCLLLLSALFFMRSRYWGLSISKANDPMIVFLLSIPPLASHSSPATWWCHYWSSLLKLYVSSIHIDVFRWKEQVFLFINIIKDSSTFSNLLRFPCIRLIPSSAAFLSIHLRKIK